MVTGPGVQQLAVLQVWCKQGQQGFNRVRKGILVGKVFVKHPGGASPRSGLSPVATRLWLQLRSSWQPTPELAGGPKKELGQIKNSLGPEARAGITGL